MEKNNLNQRTQGGYLIIPHEIIESIEKNQTEILNLLKSKFDQGSESLDFIDEKRAIELIGKKATWFWQMRKSGALNYTKVGAKVYYSLDEIKNLLATGSQSIK
jgi:thymidylate synthase